MNAPSEGPPEREENCCVECGSPLIQTSSDLVCSQCGLVHKPVLVAPTCQVIDQANGYGQAFAAPGNRAYIAEDLGSCVGQYHNSSLTDSKGKRLAPEQLQNFRRQKQINDVHMQAAGKRHLYTGLTTLNTVGGILELPTGIREDAAYLFRRYYDQLAGEGYNAELVGGALYLSLRTASSATILRLKELLQGFEQANVTVRPARILRCATRIRQLTGRQLKVLTPQDYIEQLLHRLSNAPVVLAVLTKKHRPKGAFMLELRQEAQQILQDLDPMKRSSRNPVVLASAVIVGADVLMSMKRGRKTGTLPQALIARVCGIAEFSLREHYLKIIRPLIAPRYAELGRAAQERRWQPPDLPEDAARANVIKLSPESFLVPQVL